MVSQDLLVNAVNVTNFNRESTVLVTAIQISGNIMVVIGNSL